jgi:hypothetical protein
VHKYSAPADMAYIDEDIAFWGHFTATGAKIRKTKPKIAAAKTTTAAEQKAAKILAAVNSIDENGDGSDNDSNAAEMKKKKAVTKRRPKMPIMSAKDIAEADGAELKLDDLNEKQRLAATRAIEKGDNVFITGSAVRRRM